jgi:transposase-like protein
MLRISIKNLECPFCKYDDHTLINWEITKTTTFTCFKCDKKFKLIVSTEPILKVITDPNQLAKEIII